MPIDSAPDDYETRLRASLDRQQAMRTLGARLVDVAPGRVTIDLPYDARFTQQHGFMHAGIIAAVADSACGYAAYSLMPPEAAVLTVEFKINLVAPAKGDRFVARARVLRPGRTLSTCAADVFAVTNGEEKLVATMLGTIMALLDRTDISS